MPTAAQRLVPATARSRSRFSPTVCASPFPALPGRMCRASPAQQASSAARQRAALPRRARACNHRTPAPRASLLPPGQGQSSQRSGGVGGWAVRGSKGCRPDRGWTGAEPRPDRRRTEAAHLFNLLAARFQPQGAGLAVCALSLEGAILKGERRTGSESRTAHEPWECRRKRRLAAARRCLGRRAEQRGSGLGAGSGACSQSKAGRTMRVEARGGEREREPHQARCAHGQQRCAYSAFFDGREPRATEGERESQGTRGEGSRERQRRARRARERRDRSLRGHCRHRAPSRPACSPSLPPSPIRQSSPQQQQQQQQRRR